MRVIRACSWVLARARSNDRLRRQTKTATAATATVASRNSPIWTGTPSRPVAASRNVAKQLLRTAWPGWSASRNSSTARKATAMIQEPTTLPIATSHATTPSRGATPARVNRVSRHGASTATVKLYRTRQSATLIRRPTLRLAVAAPCAASRTPPR